MNIEEYIDSGVLYDYCIDSLSPLQKAEVELMCTLHPEVKNELVQLQNALRKFAEGAAKAPSAEVKQTIWNTLENINKEIAGDLNDLPVINKYSNYTHWKQLVKSVMPENIPTETLYVPLRDANGVSQALVISYDNAEDESHDDIRESFLLLEGECECCVGDEVVRMQTGGFLELPLHTNHNIKLLSPYVVAVFQRIAV